MSRERVREKIADSLKNEPRLKGYDIQVDVHNDQTVLQGVVDTLSEKQLAERIAADRGGLPVDNAITISTDGTAIDRNVEFEVAEELNANPDVQLKNIGVDVEKGTARLIGQTESSEEIEQAQKAAASARGVKRVLNQVELEDEERVEPPHTAAESRRRGLHDQRRVNTKGKVKEPEQ